MSAIASAINAIKHVPASMGRMLLEKVDPRFKSYFGRVAAAGLDANRALDYLNERFGTSSAEKNYKETIGKSSRPDQMASQANIDQSEMPGKALRTGAAFGGAALAGGVPGLIGQAASSLGGNDSSQMGQQNPGGPNPSSPVPETEMARIRTLQEFKARQKAENDAMKPSRENLNSQFQRQYGGQEDQFIMQLRKLAEDVGL